MKEKSLWDEMVAECFGTFVLILLGDGVVANVGLAPRLASVAYNWNTIALGWGFAVAVAVYTVGGITGAHINPAVSLSMAIRRVFPWKKVVPYIIAQVVGAFLGAFAVWIIYHDGLVSAGMPNVWCTSPGATFAQPFWGGAATVSATGSYSILNTMLDEILGTAMLLWGVAAVTDNKNVGPMSNLWPVLVGFVVLAIGLSMGGTSGYAINPARDFGPRLFGLFAGTKDLFSGSYWILGPIVAPLIGGPIGVLTYDWWVGKVLQKGAQA